MPRIIGSSKNKFYFNQKKTLAAFLLGQFAIIGIAWGVHTIGENGTVPFGSGTLTLYQYSEWYLDQIGYTATSGAVKKTVWFHEGGTGQVQGDGMWCLSQIKPPGQGITNILLTSVPAESFQVYMGTSTMHINAIIDYSVNDNASRSSAFISPKNNCNGSYSINNTGVVTVVSDNPNSAAIDFSNSGTMNLTFTQSSFVASPITVGAPNTSLAYLDSATMLPKTAAIIGNIIGSNNGDTFNINAGTITGNIKGGTGTNTLNINTNFTTEGTIDKIQTIKVNNLNNANQGPIFTVNNSITNVDTSFAIASKTQTTVKDGGIISGKGQLTNSGTLDLNSGSNVSLKITNNSGGIVNVGSAISSSNVLTNSGVLNLNLGGTISSPIKFGTSGERTINLNGGTITSALTGTSDYGETINATGDYTTAATLEVQKFGNMSITSPHFIIKSPTEITFNFATGFNTETTLASGADLCGGGAISNAGALSVLSGATIGASSPMGNIINSGTINVGGDVRVKSFTNGISEPAGKGKLTAINTINILINNGGTATGSYSDSGPLQPIPSDQPPTITLSDPNSRIYVNGNATNLNADGTIPDANQPVVLFNSTSHRIVVADLDSGSVPETILLMGHNGKIGFSSTYLSANGTPPAGVTILGKNTSNVSITGTVALLQTALDNLTFTSTLPNRYGLASMSIAMNDNSSLGADPVVGSSSSDGGSNNSGFLNITAGKMITNNVTNNVGSINISGGDLSASTVNVNTITNKPGQLIKVSGAGTIGKNQAFGVVNNHGVMTFDGAGATINASSIELFHDTGYVTADSGSLTTSGTITTPINMHNGSLLTVSGGTINGVVNDVETAPNTTSTVNIVGTFSTTKGINNVKTINVGHDDSNVGNFTINNPISRLGSSFTTEQGTVVTINADKGGSISTGSGTSRATIVNAGSITLSSTATGGSAGSAGGTQTDQATLLGAINVPMGNVTNTGTFNVNTGNSYVGDFTNGLEKSSLNISKGLFKTEDIYNTIGTITVSGGDLSGRLANHNNLTNNAQQNIVVSGSGSIGKSNAFANINNYGIITIKSDATGSSAATSDVAAVATIYGTINFLGTGVNDTGVLNLAGGAVAGNIIGSSVSPNGTINVAKDFTYTGVNPRIQRIATINVTDSSKFLVNNVISNVNKKFTTAIGTTTTINNSGQLSGLGFINNAGTLTISSGLLDGVAIGTGATGAMGNVVNTGTIQADGGKIYIGTFNNQLAAAKLNINGSNLFSGDISNDSGLIAISSGDLSSISTSVASNLTNAANQTVTVSDTGTIGYNQALGTITNNGIFNAGGNIITNIFTNANKDAALNLTKGTLKTASLNNTLGAITIDGGDFSGVNANSNLTNAANQTITISTKGTIGVSQPLATITNDGTINIESSKFNVNTITNNSDGILNVDAGGTISNTTLTTTGVINLNSGGTINVPVTFGTGTTGTLNLSGGVIGGAIGGVANVAGNGTVNVVQNFTYDGINDPISNIAHINVNSGSFNVNGPVDINNSFNIATNATTILNNNGKISSTLDAILTNSGTLTMNRGGTLNIPIIFGANGGVLNLAGGSINSNIGGPANIPGHGTVNFINNLTYNDSDPTIGNIDNVNVTTGTFNINKPIVAINTAFSTAIGSTTNINSNGFIAGIGSINNAGTITLAGGTIGAKGAGTDAMPDYTINGIINTGTINVNNNVYVSGDINNGTAEALGNGGTALVYALNPPIVGDVSTPVVSAIIVNSGATIFRTGPAVLQNTGVVTVNTGGSINMPIHFGASDSGTLDLSGGLVNGDIIGSTTNTNSYGTININNDFTYTGLTSDHLNSSIISMVNVINVNKTSKFNVNNSIVGINKSFSNALKATTTISAGNSLTGSGAITNFGTMELLGGTVGSSIAPFASLTNDGTIEISKNGVGGNIYATTLNNSSDGILKVNANGVINTEAGGVINQSGIMTTSGDITSSIKFGSSVATLNILGGTITGDITGYTDSNANASANSATIVVNNTNAINLTVTDPFTTGGAIKDISSINLNSGNFIINNPITELNHAFTTLYNTTTTINATGSIAGTGAIDNTGTMILSGGQIGVVAATNIPFGGVYNNGIFVVQNDGLTNNGNMIVGSLVNGGTSSGGSSASNAANPFATYADININVTQIALNIDLNNQPLTSSVPGSQTTSENTDLKFSTSSTPPNAITIAGMDQNGGMINLIATHGILTLPTSTSATLTVTGNKSNNLYISGVLADLNHALEGLVFTPNPNYVGTDANLKIVIQNNQTTTSEDPAATDVFIPPSIPGSYSPVLNITSGIVRATSITNTSGTINISSVGADPGDLSSTDPAHPSALINAAGQTINISEHGTIGANNPLGSITNSGIINASGSNIILGESDIIVADFTNNNANALFNITNGITKTANITNTLGGITISGGDLSSVSPIATNASTLTNAANQIITVSGTGTIGAHGALGAVTNNGTINASGGSITVGTFTNNNANAVLNITSGIIKTGNIVNTSGATLGGITIGNPASLAVLQGDLSSAGAAGSSTLTNAINQTIKVTGAGTIGANGSLGTVTNYGIINAGGRSIAVGNFVNNNANAVLNVTNGTVNTGTLTNTSGTVNISNAIVRTANITNTLGSIIVSTGGDLSSIGAAGTSTLKNAANQTITVSGTGVIGGNQRLGAITNDGVFNINTPTNVGASVKIAGNFINSVTAVANFNGNMDVGNTGLNANTFNNSGVVNMVAPATLTGNYTVSGTGVHIVNIDSNNIPSTLTLNNGSAVFAPTSFIDMQNSGNSLIPNNHQYTVVANSIIAPVLTTNNILGFTDLVHYTSGIVGNNIVITSQVYPILSAVEAVGNLTAYPVATVLDNLVNSGTATGELRTALVRIYGLKTNQEVSDAVNQLLVNNFTPEIGFIPPSMVFGTIAERINLARSGINSIQTGFSAGGMQSNNGFWLKGIGGSINQQQRINSVGYNANTIGFAFGLDDQTFEDTWLGIGFSSVGTHINSKDSASKKTSVGSRQVTLYGSYSPENYYVDGFAAMAFNNYKSARSMLYNGLNYTAIANYTATQPSAKVATGYIHSLNKFFRIVPNLSIQYSTVKQNQYSETGAGGLDLRVSGATLTQLEGGVGVKFAVLHNEEDDQIIYNPDLHFMVLHDFKSSAQTTTAQFLGGGGNFSLQGAVPDKTTYNIGAALTFIRKDRLNFTINYDLRKKNKYIGHSGSVAIKYMF